MTIALAAPGSSEPERERDHEALREQEAMVPDVEGDTPELDAEDGSHVEGGSSDNGSGHADELDEAPSCPCQVEDWRCWGQHREVCNRAHATSKNDPEPASGTATDSSGLRPEGTSYEVPTPGPRREARELVERPEPERHGILLAFRGGFLGCSRRWCGTYKGGALGGLEVGYRHGFVAGVVGLSGGGGRHHHSEWFEETFDSSEGSVRFLDVGVGAVLYFVRSGRLDPFVSTRIGYTRTELHFRVPEDELEGSESVARGGVRFGLGLPLYVGSRVSLGPRFDITVPFGGKLCAALRGPRGSLSECWPVRELEEEVRVDSSGLPVPWSISLEVRIVFPVL
jgi:hypothetical protein